MENNVIRSIPKIITTVGSSRADYIVDGTADDVQIQLAIDAVNTAGGGIVFLKAGTYTVSDAIKVDDNVEVTGEYGATVINAADALNNDIIQCKDIVNGHDNIKISNLVLNGNKAGITGGTDRAGINLIHVRNVTIENNIIHDCAYSGINLDGTTTETVVIRNNISYDHDRAGINLVDGCQRVLIQGNYCYDTGTANISIGGYGSYIKISDNFCKNSGTADNITGYNYQNRHISVTGNTIYDGNNHGIHVGGDYIIVEGNSIYTTTFDGIYLFNSDSSVMSNAVVANNVIRSTGRYGIDFNKLNNSSINNNVIITPGSTGIFFDTVNNTSVQGNRIINSATNDGIRCHRSKKNNLSDNLIKNCARYGIYITDDGSTISEDNIVKNNIMYDDQGTKTQTHGIFVANSAVNNLITENYTRASDHLTASHSIVAGNIVKDNVGINPNRLYAQGNVTGDTTFDRTNGSTITATLTGNINVTLTAGKALGDTLTLVLTQNAEGSKEVTWPSNFKKAGGALVLTTTASAVDMIEMSWNGTNWYEISRSLACS